MTGTAVTALPRFIPAGEQVARQIKADLVPYSREVFADLFPRYQGIIAVMSAGIVIRAIVPLLKGKWQDPAVVVVSPDLRYAIPVIGGHHGGNELARALIPLGITPVITTATEASGAPSVEGVARELRKTVVTRGTTKAVNAALLDGPVPFYSLAGPAVVIGGPGVAFLGHGGGYAVGIGCRRGVSAQEVTEAIGSALADAGLTPGDIAIYATTVMKSAEQGLRDGIAALGGSLIYLDDRTINAQSPPTPSAAHRLGLTGVAEPCALAASVKKEHILTKKVYGRVTIAIAR